MSAELGSRLFDAICDLPEYYLTRAELAIMQAPQDYRDDHENAFKAMCWAEYRGFFRTAYAPKDPTG